MESGSATPLLRTASIGLWGSGRRPPPGTQGDVLHTYDDIRTCSADIVCMLLFPASMPRENVLKWVGRAKAWPYRRLEHVVPWKKIRSAEKHRIGRTHPNLVKPVGQIRPDFRHPPRNLVELDPKSIEATPNFGRTRLGCSASARIQRLHRPMRFSLAVRGTGC